MINLQKVLQEAYNSEINIEISCFWDGGWTVSLGDHINGYKETDIMLKANEIADTIHRMILRHYPDSDYAKKASLLKAKKDANRLARSPKE